MIVVCPTPRGGHIEHAVNLAAAAAEADGEALVVSRRGSRAYIGEVRGVRIRELFPDLLSLPLPHLLRSAMALVVENAVLVLFLLVQPRDEIVLLEEPRFPLACTVRRWMPRLVLFVHNAANHAGSPTAWTHAQDRMQSYMCRRLPCIVHGKPQEAAIRAHGAVAVEVGLPGSGAIEARTAGAVGRPVELVGVDVGGSALCIGAIRDNKGFEHAVAAATTASLPLLVAGEVLEPCYFESLQQAAGPTVRFVGRFLAAAEFNWLLASCGAVVLPYEGFSAQSGPLSRAIALGKPVVVSKNQALADQVKAYPRATQVDVRNLDSMATAIHRSLRESKPDHPTDDCPAPPSWAAVVDAVSMAAGCIS